MEQFQQVLLNVWQEACRHIEIGQSTANIAAMLVRRLPIEQVLVRRIDSVRSGLETVAAGFADAQPRRGDCPDFRVSDNGTVPFDAARRETRTDCQPAKLQSLVEWCRRGKVAHRRGKSSSFAELAELASNQHDGDVLVGPLGDPAGHCGVLVFLAAKNETFGREHVELAQLLLEPFSVALDNDFR